MKTITVPISDGKTKQVEGKVFLLKLQDETLKVFYHKSLNSINCHTVTHYASGMRIFDVTSIDKVINNRLTDRQICQNMLDNLVKRYGVSRVNSVMHNDWPILNK
jgi:hypothetical protein